MAMVRAGFEFAVLCMFSVMDYMEVRCLQFREDRTMG